MPTTSVYGLPYPELSDTPNVPLDVQDLAEAVDTTLQGSLALSGLTVGGASVNPARGSIVAYGTRDTSVGSLSAGGITTTETVVQFATFDALAGVQYQILVTIAYASSAAGDLVKLQLKRTAGATLTTGGVQFMSQEPSALVANRSQVTMLNARFSPGAGQWSAGITAVRSSGSGNILCFGSVNQINTIMVTVA